jgi:hypothetical protein
VFGYNRGEDGPAMTVVCYVMNGDDQLLISTMAARSEARVVGGGWKVSVCVLGEKWPPSYVQVYGDAVVGRAAELAAGVLNQVLGLLAGEPVPPQRWPQVKKMAQRENRAVIRVRPNRHFLKRRLQGFGGLDHSTAAANISGHPEGLPAGHSWARTCCLRAVRGWQVPPVISGYLRRRETRRAVRRPVRRATLRAPNISYLRCVSMEPSCLGGGRRLHGVQFLRLVG